MDYIRNMFESMAKQLFGKTLKNIDAGPIVIAFAIFYLAEVIREKELK
jgi:hypothetical protein